MRSSQSYINDILNDVSLNPNKPGNVILFNFIFFSNVQKQEPNLTMVIYLISTIQWIKSQAKSQKVWE